jgi:hypothetical protein
MCLSNYNCLTSCWENVNWHESDVTDLATDLHLASERGGSLVLHEENIFTVSTPSSFCQHYTKFQVFESLIVHFTGLKDTAQSDGRSNHLEGSVCRISVVKLKVKLSRDRLGQALGVPRG